jgi:hypothetical protein
VTTFSVGYFVGSLAKESINRKLANALVRLAPAELVMSEIPFRDLPLYCYDSDADFPPPARALKEAIARVDAIPLRDARIQPIDSRRLEECDRLGQPPVGSEFVCAQTLRDHRHVSGQDRNGHRTGAPAQHHGLL